MLSCQLHFIVVVKIVFINEVPFITGNIQLQKFHMESTKLTIFFNRDRIEILVLKVYTTQVSSVIYSENSN